MPIDNPGMLSNPDSSGSGGGSNQDSQAIQPTRLNNDSLIQIEGQDKPVKFSEHVRGFQSQATKATQERAKLAERLQQIEQQLKEKEQLAQQYEGRIKTYESSQRTGQAGKSNELVDAIKSLPYLDGASAAQVVGWITEQLGGTTTQFSSALEQRDKAIALLYQQLKKVTDNLNTIDTRYRTSDFQTKMNKFVGDAGLPKEAVEFASELYLAYEGDDLDDEFPTILQNRWNQIQNMIRAQEKAKIAHAKQLPFTPGRGGNGAAVKPLKLAANATPKQITDQIWDAMQESET